VSTISCRFRPMYACAVALTAAAIAGCAMDPVSPQPVHASNPSVTFNYRTDQELLQANQSATTYCTQYQASPRTVNIASNADGSKMVVFECVPTTLVALPPAAPAQSYTARTDQELLQASQTANGYCLKHGSQPMTTNIVTNANGTRTITFQCGLR
jgi:hypothetical protein